jgi:hypothetical protein
VIGRCGDIEGVWIDPVIAQLMMTDFDFDMGFLRRTAAGRLSAPSMSYSSQYRCTRKKSIDIDKVDFMRELPGMPIASPPIRRDDLQGGEASWRNRCETWMSW